MAKSKSTVAAPRPAPPHADHTIARFFSALTAVAKAPASSPHSVPPRANLHQLPKGQKR